jgi:OmpA family
MRALILGCSLLALAAPMAHAQLTEAPAPSTGAAVTAPGTYLVFFGFDEATLTPEGRQVVAEAANAYQQSGSAVVSVVGHTDTVGSESYNYELGQRRAEAVAAELTRLGVAPSAISTTSRGEQDLLVPTGDEVREPQNRRVVIDVPQPAPPPVMAEPVVAAPMPEPEPEPGRFTFTVGGLFGHNFAETDGQGGRDKTENDLAGVELTFDALPGFLGGLSFKQAALWSINGVDDGLSGRSVLSLNLMPLNLVVFRPFLSANFGGVYGEGVQDGLVAGPELGFDIGITESTILRAKVAYDFQFRNPTYDEGIAWGGLSLGWRF